MRWKISARAAVPLVVAVPLARWLWGVAAAVPRAAAAGVPVRADEVLAALAAGGALLMVLAVAASIVLDLLGLLPGLIGHAARALAAAVTPRLLARTTAALLGLGVVAGLAPGASVAAPTSVVAVVSPLPDPGFGGLDVATPDPGFGGLDATSSPPAGDPQQAPSPGWVPEPPAVRPQPDVRVLSPAPRPADPVGLSRDVVVHRGDTLWSIAARHLGHDPSDAQIARAWPAWFDANRDVIGDDPDLLLPGQVLRAPQEIRS